MTNYMKSLAAYTCALILACSFAYTDGDDAYQSHGGKGSCAPACCQTLCDVASSIQSLITQNGIINYEIHSVCRFCLIIGEKPTQTGIKHLWYVNPCGALEELSPNHNYTRICVTGLKACNVCFIKATFTDSECHSVVKVWRIEPDCSLNELTWHGVPCITDFSVTGVKECGLCFIKGTVSLKDCMHFEVLWLVDSDGCLISLVGKEEASPSINVLGIKVCNLCFVKATISHVDRPPYVVLWRVECDGSLTRLIGHGTGITAYFVDLVSIRECNSCFIRADIINDSGCSSLIWKVEPNGSLSDKRFSTTNSKIKSNVHAAFFNGNNGLNNGIDGMNKKDCCPWRNLPENWEK